MSFDVAVARVSEIRGLFAPAPAPAVQQTQTPPTDTKAFQRTLTATTARAATTTQTADGSTADRMLQLARQELAKGVQETGANNDSPDIARYRTATQGAVAGAPWCAYFVSYIAKQAGAPIGLNGEGMGLVDNVTAWAKQTGRFFPTSETPKPGNVALFDEHIGIVDEVLPGGKVRLIEGNSSNKVQTVERSLSELVGFARI